METKAIMISAKPKECANILNSIQSALARTTFSRNYVGWVYIYCTKDNKEGLHIVKDKWVCIKHNKVLKECCYNGTVVAKFWCDKVKHFEFGCWSGGLGGNPDIGYFFDDGSKLEKETMPEKFCISSDEFFDRFECGEGYIIPISDLKVFDKSKEIKEFFKKSPCKYNKWNFAKDTHLSEDGQYLVIPFKLGYCYAPRMNTAPKSWCYIEVY